MILHQAGWPQGYSTCDSSCSLLRISSPLRVPSGLQVGQSGLCILSRDNSRQIQRLEFNFHLACLLGSRVSRLRRMTRPTFAARAP
jgi:hypothetical protein